MVLSGEPRKKSPVTPPEIDPGTVRLVTQCLNHYASPSPFINIVVQINEEMNYVGTNMNFFEAATNERKSNVVKKQR